MFWSRWLPGLGLSLLALASWATGIEVGKLTPEQIVSTCIQFAAEDQVAAELREEYLTQCRQDIQELQTQAPITELPPEDDEKS